MAVTPSHAFRRERLAIIVYSMCRDLSGQVRSMEITVIDFVTLTEVPVSGKQVIANLIQLYKYDFSGNRVAVW